MRVWSRIALTVAVLLGIAAPPASADHFLADCPLTLVASNPPATSLNQSPHGVFRFGSQVFVLRGQTLTTYNVTDLGDMQIAREDFVGAMGAREENGGLAFANGYLYVSSEAGLEIFDLRNVRAGGNAPLLISRTPGLHYRRIAVNGNTLAALYPATDLPCAPNLLTCTNQIDIYNMSNLNSPNRVASIRAFGTFPIAYNDIAFNNNFLIATAVGGTFVYSLVNQSSPIGIYADPRPGTFLASNGTNLVAVGNDDSIETYSIDPAGGMTPITLHTIATLRLERSNPIMFHPQAWIDDTNGRLITMVDEKDPQTLKPARTFAFDVFDYTVPMYEGSDPRVYEYISYTQGDEVKSNPVAVGPYVYVIGEMTGLQTYGACGQVAGRIEFDSTRALNCGGAEIHGWVTGDQKIESVELFLDGGSLGQAQMTGAPRTDIASKTPVSPWRIAVNLDATTKGDHILRAIGTDANGNRRQFASQRVYFNGPGQNCTARRRSGGLR